jgi:hypothetical protein
MRTWLQAISQQFEIGKWPRNDPIICWSITEVIIEIPHESIAITMARPSANTEHKCTWRSKKHENCWIRQTKDVNVFNVLWVSQGHLEFILHCIVPSKSTYGRGWQSINQDIWESLLAGRHMHTRKMQQSTHLFISIENFSSHLNRPE